MSLKCEPRTIKQLHGQLSHRLGGLLVGELSFESPQDTAGSAAWIKKHYQGSVVFNLISSDLAISQASHRLGAKLVMIKGTEDEENRAGWVSWSDSWKAARHHETLVFDGGGFTFYWGRRWDVDEILFRAEWDDIDSGSDHAAQPHWHWDIAFTSQLLTMGRIHFPMAGWNRQGEIPGCWSQYPVGIGCVLEWAEKTLKYACDQIIRWPPRNSN